MSPNNSAILFVDVAKLTLQPCLAGQFHSWPMTQKVTPISSNSSARSPKAHVICAATGDYEQPPVCALQSAGLAVSILEPGRVRHSPKPKAPAPKPTPLMPPSRPNTAKPSHPPRPQLGDLKVVAPLPHPLRRCLRQKTIPATSQLPSSWRPSARCATNASSKEFYQCLLAAGKKPSVALTSFTRKLVILMNRLKDDKCQPAHLIPLLESPGYFDDIGRFIVALFK